MTHNDPIENSERKDRVIPGRDSSRPLLEQLTVGKESGENSRSMFDKNDALVREARKFIAEMLEAMDVAGNMENVPTPSFSRTPLKAFSSSETISVESFKISGGLRSIVLGVRKYFESAKVVATGCQALAVLTLVDSGLIKEALALGCVESVIAAIQTQSLATEVDAVVAAFKILRNLTQLEECRSEIFKSRGVESVVEAMRHNESSARVLSHGALVLSNMAFGNTEIKNAVGALGGLSAIAKGMKENRENQGMQTRGSLAIRNLCYNSESNQKIAGESSAVEALVGTIQIYKDDREIVHQCCVALMNLSNESAKNRRRIVDANGATLLVEMIQRFPDSLSMHDDCISIIRNIAVESTEAQREMGNRGGVGCVCRALEKFRKDERVSQKACAAIRFLCFTAENRKRVGAVHGIESLVRTLRAHVASAVVVEHALLAIGNATFQNEENKAAGEKCGGIAAIVQALEQHRLRATIQEHGCRVLRNLVDGVEENKGTAVAAGAITAAVFAMMGYPQNALVQEQACAMMLNLSANEEYLDKLRQSDVLRLAEKAISIHYKHRGVRLQAGYLVDRLSGFDILEAGQGYSERGPQLGNGRSGRFFGFILGRR